MDATKFSAWRPTYAEQISRKKGWNVPKQNIECRTGRTILIPCANAVTLRFGYLRIRYPSGMRPTGVYDGTGTPRLYTDFAIITCHEDPAGLQTTPTAAASLTPCFNS